MKTIKQLEKEIEKGREKVMSNHQRTDSPFFLEVAFKEVQLQTLKDILKLIDEWNNKIGLRHISLMDIEELKQKIKG